MQLWSTFGNRHRRTDQSLDLSLPFLPKNAPAAFLALKHAFEAAPSKPWDSHRGMSALGTKGEEWSSTSVRVGPAGIHRLLRRSSNDVRLVFGTDVAYVIEAIQNAAQPVAHPDVSSAGPCPAAVAG